jgi:hypothetical protein
MVPHAPPAVAPPPVLRLDGKNLERLTSMRSKPPNLNVCPAPCSIRHFCRPRQTEARLVLMHKRRNRHGDFDDQIIKSQLPVLSPKPRNPPPPWFYGSTKKPTIGFEAKPKKTITTGFEVKPEKINATGFEAKPDKPVPTGFEAKSEKPVTTGFEAKSDKPVPVVLRPNH